MSNTISFEIALKSGKIFTIYDLRGYENFRDFAKEAHIEDSKGVLLFNDLAIPTREISYVQEVKKKVNMGWW